MFCGQIVRRKVISQEFSVLKLIPHAVLSGASLLNVDSLTHVSASGHKLSAFFSTLCVAVVVSCVCFN